MRFVDPDHRPTASAMHAVSGWICILQRRPLQRFRERRERERERKLHDAQWQQSLEVSGQS
jgi:hypothetical protein